MTELLVILACTQGSGCSNTATAYYYSNPNLIELVKTKQAKVTQTLGAYAPYITPMIVFYKNKGEIYLSKSYHLEYNKDESKVLFAYRYYF